MNRLGLTDSTQDSITKMADGNPGAVSVLVQLIQNHSPFRTQTDAMMAELMQDLFGIDHHMLSAELNLLALDSAGIYGSRIWMLYKDVCDQNITRVQWLLTQLRTGEIGEDEVNHAIDNYGEGITIPTEIG